MTDPTEIARSAIEVQAYEMAMALGDLLIATDGMKNLRDTRTKAVAAMSAFTIVHSLYCRAMREEAGG